MSSDSPSSDRARGFLKRVAHGAKKVFKPNDQVPTSHAPAPPPPGDPPPQLTPSHKPDPGPLLQPPTKSQQPAAPPQSAPSALLVAGGGNQPVSPESSVTLAAKRAGADAWSGLKAALNLLKESSEVFPPVKSALAEFMGVIDIFETAAQSRKDYAELASNLRGMVNEFKEHPGEQSSSQMSEALAAMANGLEKEMKHVEQKRQRSGVRRFAQAEQDMDDVQGCYRRVETLRRELQNKALVNMWRNQEQQQVDILLKELSAALKAMYDSSLADIVGRRTCTPGTRQAILAEMREWADNPDGPNVYWLNGMAGTGKTTLAYSFCDAMQHDRRLGASFFCSRADADSRDVSKIVPTIAHQLARLLPSYREALVRQMSEDKEIGARRTVTQFEKLIRDPLREVMASVPEGIVVTIDALDECDRRDGARDILNVLFLHARDLPIKFFVTCRPEPGLFDALQSQDERYRSALHLHNIEASFVQADIKTFLEAELAETSLSSEKLGMLAEQAGSLFIYAATAARYIRPQNRQVNVHQRLEDLLSIGSKIRTNKHKGIDELYTAVLAAPFADEELNPQELDNIRLVLDTAVCAREPMSVTTMTKLLGLDDEQDIVYALQHLRSVLHVSEGTDLISTLHASFPDFLLDRKRSKDLYCDATEQNGLLALHCLSAMKRLLSFNICELESSFVLDEKIPDLARKVDKAISSELFYACRYWGVHLGLSKASNSVQSGVQEFLSNRLLFWMEVLNLRNCISAGAAMLAHVHGWLQRSGGAKDALELAQDAGRFVTAFGLSPASRSTPHIYISALPFWPETRPVRLCYWKRTQGMIRLEGPGMEGRDLSRLAAWNTASGVWCVAASPDGTRIASSSNNGIIQVWDAQSGDLVVGPFKGHTGRVTSVAFSPDGARIVSSSWDNTVRIWDAHSGLPVAKPSEGHTHRVLSVAFSPDGARIVSGSADATIRVWDASNGDLIAGPLEGHTDSVNSVSFSSDGARIVSGSDDRTIRVWDAHSGLTAAGLFEGHTEAVRSVAFSPDGIHIVSGSEDSTIRVWDARSGDLVVGPFEGHTISVNSVAFSPDGTCIASGSSDRTIRVWNASSGLMVAGPFEGHTGSINSVVFSSDSNRIFSGSRDRTIRVWDANSGPLIGSPFEGNTQIINSVSFSPDGTRIASGSDANTICVWDAYSGDLVAGPFEGHTQRVLSVAFSPDGARIASGSADGTVRVWDARNGDLVAGPFEGHTTSVYAASFSPDGTLIVSGSYDETIRVWNADNGDLVVGPLVGHTSRVTSVAFSPDGACITSGSGDRTIRVWDARSGDNVIGPIEGHASTVSSVAFSPDGTLIVSGSDDMTIRVWDASSGLLVSGPFQGHTNMVYSVAFSPDSTQIVSGSWDATIRVWDSRRGLLMAGPFEGHTDQVNSAAFSPDGARIVSGSNDGTIRVWVIAPLDAHDPGHLKDWLMDKTGVITTRQGQILLCVPVDLWARIIRPDNTVFISAKGVLKLDFDDILLGNQWVKCYQCQ